MPIKKRIVILVLVVQKILTGSLHMKNLMEHEFHRRGLLFKSPIFLKNFLLYYKHRAFDHTNSHGHMTSRTIVTSFFRQISSATLGPKITMFTWENVESQSR